tara:strand:- start:4897 stop:5277 length:381 start_codon:yes stop_codon:yes gene_type:complete
MPRPKRKSVKLDTESITKILQESYNETCDVRSKAIAMLNKQTKDVNDNNDIQQVGKINNELLRIIDSSIGKKLDIVKLQVNVVKTAESSNTSSNSPDLTDEDKALIEEMIKRSEVKESDSDVSYDV